MSSIGNGDAPFQGTLDKRGRWNTAWRTRHVILTPAGDLCYYASAAAAARSEAPYGVIPIAPPHHGAAAATIAIGGWDEGRALFTVRANAEHGSMENGGPAAGRTYVFGAATEALRSAWVARLQRAAAGHTAGAEDTGRPTQPASFSASAPPQPVPHGPQEASIALVGSGSLGGPGPGSPPEEARLAALELARRRRRLGAAAADCRRMAQTASPC